MEIGEFIYNRRKELGLTLEDVGRAVGVGKSTVKKWETGYIKDMRRDKISALAKVLDVSPSVLITNTDSTDNTAAKPNYPNIFPIETHKIPLLGEIACGQPIFADEDRESYVLAGTNVKADFCLRCVGDSMIGARINDGDIVFIQKCDTVNNGEIAAVIIDDEATLKRVNYFPEKNLLILKAENPKFPDLVYSGEELDHVHIIGKAIAFQSDID